MKQKTITTDKATVLAIEIGDLQDMIGVEQGCIWYLRRFNNQLVDKTIKLPKGNWQLLGRMHDITEDQAVCYVDRLIYNDEEHGDMDVYRDYVDNDYTHFALDSLYSLLQDNEVYFENPVSVDKGQMFSDESISAFKDWQEAQSKVWDRERTYILTKVD